MSPTHQKPNSFDTDLGMSNLSIGAERAAPRQEVEAVSAVRMRHIPVHKTNEDLRNMLLFTSDLVTVEFVPSNMPEDKGYQTAVARFKTSGAAHEAQSSLNGKSLTANHPPMVVEVLRLSPSGRNVLNQSAYRADSNSSNASSGGQVRQSSRFNAAFPSMESMPGSNGTQSYTNGPPSSGEVVSPRGTYFPPQSPVDQRHRVAGNTVIGEDGVDEDLTDLLKDPVAYAESDQPSLSRRSTNNTSLPQSRWVGLSLATGNPASPPLSNFSPPRNGTLQSPSSIAMSPTMMGQNGNFQMPYPHPQRHNYPPVNPADQNPPCNTLYVGNLPIDTSEDELKTLFSKQRGYKRLCFRTKQNGPMCFVEFEDTTFATKTLNELYGYSLHNSVKGGIRLSFSKNPLGVRNGQPGGMGPLSPLSPTGPTANGIGGGSFSTAHGPPPGLSAPPGLAQQSNIVSGMNGMNDMGNSTSMSAMNMGYSSPTSMGPAGMSFGLHGMNDMGVAQGGMRGPPTNGVWGQQAQYNHGQQGLHNAIQPGQQQVLYRGHQHAQPRGASQYNEGQQRQYSGDQQEKYGEVHQGDYGDNQQEGYNGGQQGPNGNQQTQYREYGHVR